MGIAGQTLAAGERVASAGNSGDLALLSTPCGERGFFWREWSQGEGWKRLEVKATDYPRIGTTVLEAERRTQTAERFAQEYLCSFVGMDNAAFRQEWLEAAVRKGPITKALNFRMRGGTLG